LIAPELADKFIFTGSDGKTAGKAESLANAKATKYDSVEYTNLKVTAFGDTAIATGDFVAKGTDQDGKPMDVHERFTDTWVKMSNKAAPSRFLKAASPFEPVTSALLPKKQALFS
jgi:hypothetical protein